MVPQGLITNVALIGLSAGIFFTYLQPNFSEVRDRQDEVATYKSERAKVADVNKVLQRLVTDAAGISEQDRALLNRYLPAEIDSVAVQRDILLVLDNMGIVPEALSADGEGSAAVASTEEVGVVSVASESKLVPYQFNVALTLGYGEVLESLRLFEQNAYPLDVVTVDIVSSSDSASSEENDVSVPGALTVDLGITTYALTRPEKTE